MFKLKNLPLEKLLFAVSLTFLVFIFGVLYGLFHIPPTDLIAQVIVLILDPEERDKTFIQSAYIRNVEYTYPVKALNTFMNGEPLDQNSNGLVGYDQSKVQNGYTLINGMYKNDYALKLIDIKGNLVHKWVVPYCKFWDCKNDNNQQTTNWVNEIGGSILYPNGDVVFSHQYSALMKLDKDSNVIWKKDYKAHHLMFQDKEGNIWTPAVKSGNAEYQFGENKIIIQNPEVLYKVSPDGDLLEEYDILDIIINSDKKGLFASHLNYYYAQKNPVTLRGLALTHLNDVEIVEDPAVYSLPMFEKGDILVSMNRINAIVLIDKEDKKIKWDFINPFVRQHDPDILNNGNIMVFDNNGGGDQGFLDRRSRILSINPLTGETEIVFEKNKDNRFYSFNRGNQHYLPNGNLFIVESTKGHLFEIDKSGQVVWEYYDIWDKDYVSFISQAQRFPADFVDFLEEK